MFSTVTLLALAAVATAQTNSANVEFNLATFNPFDMNVARQNQVDRLRALTADGAKPVTDFCTGKNGAEKTKCVADLGAELAQIQSELTKDFFDAVIRQFNFIGTPFNRNKIFNFDNNAECQTEINAQEAAFKALGLDADAAAVKACNVNCSNQLGPLQLAASCVQEKARIALRAQQALATGKVAQTLDQLDRSHRPVFDKNFVAAQQNEFVDISDDAARLQQSIDGFVAGQLARAVLQGREKKYEDYKQGVQSTLNAEVQQVVAEFVKVLEKDARIADAKLKIDAGKKQADGLLIDAALKLAAARKNRVISPVVIHARVNNVDAMQAQNIQNAFKAVLGPETAVSAIVDDKANAGKKQFDVAIGVDQAEIETQDSEFGIACVQQNVDCQILADVHKPLFDLVQTKAVVKAPAGNGGGNEYGAPNPHHGGAGEEAAASSLFVAAGAVLAALAMFL